MLPTPVTLGPFLYSCLVCCMYLHRLSRAFVTHIPCFTHRASDRSPFADVPPAENAGPHPLLDGAGQDGASHPHAGHQAHGQLLQHVLLHERAVRLRAAAARLTGWRQGAQVTAMSRGDVTLDGQCNVMSRLTVWLGSGRELAAWPIVDATLRSVRIRCGSCNT